MVEGIVRLRMRLLLLLSLPVERGSEGSIDGATGRRVTKIRRWSAGQGTTTLALSRGMARLQSCWQRAMTMTKEGYRWCDLRLLSMSIERRGGKSGGRWL
ncbi:hypothetical protein B296_00005353 [Ensete ventricosum]|uniref:Secreted protein n=1 Tax=Ensete ventricosum TaxID=4639 RepID=A0A427B479_ENSVE|nr:hypothetical protein B296_00005353 [Ensete ventricosum]